jgi:hypothetical protein
VIRGLRGGCRASSHGRPPVDRPERCPDGLAGLDLADDVVGKLLLANAARVLGLE